MIETITAYKCPSCSKLYETELEVTNCLVKCSDNCSEEVVIKTYENDTDMNISISYNEDKWSRVIDGKGELYIEQDGYGLLIPSSKVAELCDGLNKFKTMWVAKKYWNKSMKGDDSDV